MEIKLDKKEFLKEIEKIVCLSDSKVGIEIINTFMVECLENKIKLTATNLTDSIVCYCNAVIEDPLSLCIPSKKLFEIIKAFSNNIIYITSDNEYNLKITDKKSRFSMKGFSVEDFPKVSNQINPEKSIELVSNNLVDMIHKTIYAVSHDQTRYVLMGLCFDIKKNNLKICATDGRRMSLVKSSVISNIDETKFIVSTGSCMSLLKLLTQNNQNIIISQEESFIIFAIGETIFATKAIDGTYPDITKIIPKEFKYVLKISKKELENIHKRSLIVKEQTSIGQIIATIANNRAEFKNKQNPNNPLAFEEDMEIEYTGEEIITSYQIEYVLDFLKNSLADKIIFSYNNPVNPFVLAQDIENNNYINMIMPMRIN